MRGGFPQLSRPEPSGKTGIQGKVLARISDKDYFPVETEL